MTRIFFVDGDETARERLSRALCSRDFDVTVFESARAALEALSDGPPELLISKVQMTEMSGIDLAEAARKIAPELPVILMADDTSAAIQARANNLGIRYVLTKSTGDLGDLRTAIRKELSRNRAFDSVHELDEIRLEFFTDLSHKLRTPLTAMKLALEGLFSHMCGVMDPAQRELAEVNSRNIERVVKLVENQLDLLQMMMGESRIIRRMIDLNEMVREIPRRVFGDQQSACGEAIEIRTGSQKDKPLYLCTDPAPLATIIDSLLGGGPVKIKRTIGLEYDAESRCCVLDIELDYLGATCCAQPNQPEADYGIEECGLQRLDFEYRAYKNVLSQLGGDVEMEKDVNYKRVRISLPRYPEYDRHKDFLGPIRIIRDTAEDTGRNVSFVKCDLIGHLSGDYLDTGDRRAEEFFTRVESILSEGDYVLRGEQSHTLYLALLERTPSELDRIRSFLDGHASGRSGRRGLHVTGPHIIIQDYCEVIELTRERELV